MNSSDSATAASSSSSGNSPGGISQATTPTAVNVKTLIEAGAHFGHQTTKWNPKMLPYIYGQRNGIHIINLDLTLQLWERARKVIVDTLAIGGQILFVGTKQQARDIVAAEAVRCGAHSVTTRWLGGTLSNFQTIKFSIDRMRKVEELLVKADDESSEIEIKKKEKLMIKRQLGKLEGTLGGIRTMRKPPELIFVVDINKEAIAVAEARRLHIPVVALVDTNCDPSKVEFPIPSNDDAGRTIKLLVAAVGDAVIEGRAIFEARGAKEQRDKEGNGHGSSKRANGAAEKLAGDELERPASESLSVP